ncbi:hypothetical protein BY458DRAFT_431360 [Sporodiniella umbellata]|nr:hypothetical protein BY458DRAFT_431360 [Sporodiniella umbellata]
MEVSFELENILEDTGIQIFCRERVEWQISFLSKEGSSNDFLLQLFQRYADEVHRPPRIAIFKVKHSDPSIKQQHIAICNKMIGEQTFLVGHFLIDATNFRGVYSHFGDIIFKELERTIVAQKEDMADCQNKENSIKGTTKHCDDTEEFSIYSEETFLKRGESSNRYLEDQKMKQLREQRQEESKKIDFYFPKKKREDRRKQKEHTLIPAALSSLSVNGDDEKKKVPVYP